VAAVGAILTINFIDREYNSNPPNFTYEVWKADMKNTRETVHGFPDILLSPDG